MQDKEEFREINSLLMMKGFQFWKKETQSVLGSKYLEKQLEDHLELSIRHMTIKENNLLD